MYLVHSCFLQADLEEAKSQENAKLQAALQEVQQQYKETKEILVQEREAAKKAAEIAPVIKEVPVIDTELMNKLRDENDKLKVRPEHKNYLNVLCFPGQTISFYFSIQLVFVHAYVYITFSAMLQTLVSSLEKKIDDTEKKYQETSKISEDRLKQAMDAETKIVDLNMAMLRFSIVLVTA